MTNNMINSMKNKEGLKEASRTWESLNPEISEWLLNAVYSLGFEKMTPVQASTIPLFSGNKDVVVEAVTGSGKTLSYLIPVIEKLLKSDEKLKKHHIGAIIISPTRELAGQIYSVLKSLLEFHSPSSIEMKRCRLNEDEDENENGDGYNGKNTPKDNNDSNVLAYSNDIKKILPQLVVGGSKTPFQDLQTFLKNSPNIVIGTPGRLLDLLTSQAVHCSQSFETLVLDEADRLLDLGFQNDLQKILQRLPKQRRTGLFSASVSEAVDQLIRVGLRNPVKVSVRVKNEFGKLDGKTPSSLQISYTTLKPTEKLPGLKKLFDDILPLPQKSIIYLSTCAAVNYFQHILPKLLKKYEIIPLHGKLDSRVRDKNFERFKQSILPNILLTTNVAARGLDIPLVDLVVQFDPPSDPKVFIHRCGRAGRAGRKGLALTFLTPGNEENYVEYLRIRKIPIKKLDKPIINITEEDIDSTVKMIRKTLLSDRLLHDISQKAFVSWVQSYNKHQAKSIFSINDIDWYEYSNSWGLLKLPKMPEIKHWKGDWKLGLNIDFDDFKYKDKKREDQRIEQLKSQKTNDPVSKNDKRVNGDSVKDQKDQIQNGHKKLKSESWSDKKDYKIERDLRREKKQARKDYERINNLTRDQINEKVELDELIDRVRIQNSIKKNIIEEEWKGFD